MATPALGMFQRTGLDGPNQPQGVQRSVFSRLLTSPPQDTSKLRGLCRGWQGLADVRPELPGSAVCSAHGPGALGWLALLAMAQSVHSSVFSLPCWWLSASSEHSPCWVHPAIAEGWRSQGNKKPAPGPADDSFQEVNRLLLFFFFIFSLKYS